MKKIKSVFTLFPVLLFLLSPNFAFSYDYGLSDYVPDWTGGIHFEIQVYSSGSIYVPDFDNNTWQDTWTRIPVDLDQTSGNTLSDNTPGYADDAYYDGWGVFKISGIDKVSSTEGLVRVWTYGDDDHFMEGVYYDIDDDKVIAKGTPAETDFDYGIYAEGGVFELYTVSGPGNNTFAYSNNGFHAGQFTDESDFAGTDGYYAGGSNMITDGNLYMKALFQDGFFSEDLSYTYYGTITGENTLVDTNFWASIDPSNPGNTGMAWDSDYYQSSVSDAVADIQIDISGMGTSNPLKGFNFFSQSDDANAVIPEPATMLLMGTGLIGLAGLGRKKKGFKK